MTVETFFKHYDKENKRYLTDTDLQYFFDEMSIEIPKKMWEAIINKIGYTYNDIK